MRYKILLTSLMLMLALGVSAQAYNGPWIPISVDDMPAGFFGEWYSNGTWNISAHEDHLRTGNVYYDYGAVLEHATNSSLYCLVLINDGGWRIMIIRINSRLSMDVAEPANTMRWTNHTKE